MKTLSKEMRYKDKRAMLMPENSSQEVEKFEENSRGLLWL
jgi:hypothetical protein